MAITFPRNLPTAVKWDVGSRIDLQYQQLTALSEGGQPQVANIGADLWRARFRTVPLTEPVAETLAAWLASLRGGAKLFYAPAVWRRRPINYRNGFTGLVIAGGSTPFIGQAVVQSITALRDGLTLSGLPAAYVVATGDMLTLPYGSGGYSLHRVIEGATASAGGVAAVTVEPSVMSTTPVSTTAYLASPWMVATLDAKSVRASGQRGRFTTFEFEAGQYL